MSTDLPTFDLSDTRADVVVEAIWPLLNPDQFHWISSAAGLGSLHLVPSPQNLTDVLLFGLAAGGSEGWKLSIYGWSRYQGAAPELTRLVIAKTFDLQGAAATVANLQVATADVFIW